MHRFRTLCLVGSLLTASVASAATMPVVCVESVWCNIAAQIGGPEITTQALISTPGIDPHELTPTPSMARQTARAALVILNGATYDDWALPFVSSSAPRIIAAQEAGWNVGDNPHLFLNPGAVRKVAKAMARALIQQGLDHEAVQRRLNVFLKQIDDLEVHSDQLRKNYEGTAIAAMEPVGADLIQSMGLHIVDTGFALAVMHHAEATPQDVAVLETALDEKAVKLLIVNPAVRSPQIDRMVEKAKERGMPIAVIGETLPPGLSWQDWVSSIIESVQKALDGASR
ncbi:metal ABC transporter solute-binding protein, Zn/Mn family [Gluconobacter japonicus]|uniref:metal ABC transporter solute-binding protein, Zn/Mn family n=1 Tax=Gluconobacter japonicus TaxID=376620 RepID=UPI001B8D3320|nr:zinc ABC transporter substrate-binding protein [Gluconobacter japonicus]MBS1049786.1 zinc ABC transporter substrate-binding protein [Gluconobacter japonicus]